MAMGSELLIFVGSLVAIFALAGLAMLLGLGRDPTLANEAEAQRWAGEVHDGYVAVRVSLDSKGKGALLEDEAEQIMILKPHGGHFAGRILDASSSVKRQDDSLVIDSGEARYGAVRLQIADAQVWAERIHGLGKRGNARV